MVAYRYAGMSPEEELQDEVDNVMREMLRRYAAYGDIGAANEAMRREYVSPLLISMVQLFPGIHKKLKGLSMWLERRTSGEIGRGHVDFVFLYKQIQIIVSEAKKEDVDEGVARNVAQLYSARQV